MRFGLLLALGLALPACASRGSYGPDPDAGGEYAALGGYAGAAAMFSRQQFQDMDRTHAGDSHVGMGARLGYRFHPNLAVEVEGDAATDHRISSGIDGRDVDHLDFRSVVLQGKWFLTRARLQPYLLLGEGVTNTNRDGGDFVSRGGVGLDFWLNEGTALFAEGTYNRPAGSMRDLWHTDIQLGLTIRF